MRSMLFVCFLFAGQAQAAAIYDFITDSVGADIGIAHRPPDEFSESWVRGMLGRLGVTMTEDEAAIKFDVFPDHRLVVTESQGFLQASFLSGSYFNGAFNIGLLDRSADIALTRSGDTLNGHFTSNTEFDGITMSGDAGLWSGIFSSDETLGHHPITGHWVLIAEVAEPPVWSLLLLIGSYVIVFFRPRAITTQVGGFIKPCTVRETSDASTFSSRARALIEPAFSTRSFSSATRPSLST